MSLSDRELQSLRNQANECEDAADEIVCLRERIRVLREVVESAAAADAFCADAGCRERLAAMARAALEASNE